MFSKSTFSLRIHNDFDFYVFVNTTNMPGNGDVKQFSIIGQLKKTVTLDSPLQFENVVYSIVSGLFVMMES